MVSHLTHVMTLANGIIGVSVLAMPFCFKQCGIILGILLLLLSSIMSRLACHFLVKSAVMSRRRNFELLAFHAFGHMGKFFVELLIIGFLFGTCIAFFVVVGDLGPGIVGKVINKNPEDIRNGLLLTTGIFIILPLGLLRNIDSLSSISIATIGFYICLVLKVIGESTQHIFSGDWYENVNLWRPAGILQCLPIFSMALFCQTQLFEIYESVPNVSLEKMNEIVRNALNICTGVYVSVGLFGYIACCTQPFTGNILMCFEPSTSSEIIKLCFVFSVAFSFPLVIFPCRASLNSLFFRRAYTHEASSSYMPEARFRFLTFLIVAISVIIGILIPNIEFVLGLLGATNGVMICIIFPAIFFISISPKNTNERLLAQAIIFVGVLIMILGTYVNLYAMEESNNTRVATTTDKAVDQINNLPDGLIKNNIPVVPNIPNNLDTLKSNKDIPGVPDFKVPAKDDKQWNIPKEVPVSEKSEKVTQKPIKKISKLKKIVPAPLKMNQVIEKVRNMNVDSSKESKIMYKDNDIANRNDPAISMGEKKLELMKEKYKTINPQKNENLINSDAIKKEDLELAEDHELVQLEIAKTHEKLQKTLEKHKMEQLEMMQEQKEILEDLKKQEIKFEKEQEERLAKDTESVKRNDQVEERKKVKSVKIEAINDQNLLVNGNEKSNTINNEKLVRHDEKNEPEEIKKDSMVLETDTKNVITEGKDNNKPKQEIESKHGDETKNVQKPSEIINENVALVDRFESKPDLENNIIEDVAKKPSSDILKDLKKETLIENVVEKLSQNQEKNVVNDEALLKKETLNEEKEADRLQEYSLPIVLKMSNQTKIHNNSGQLVNESPEQFAVALTEILHNYEREKREAENKDEFKETEFKEANGNPGGIPESCAKRNNDVFSKQFPIEKESLKEQSTTDLIIKTNAYLSQQSFTEKISVDRNLVANREIVQLNNRDLKALKSDKDEGL